MDIRKFGIAIAIAILTGIFIYAVADAIAPVVDYSACYERQAKIYQDPSLAGRNCSAVPVDRAAEKACVDAENMYQATYDEYGCVSGYECSTCEREAAEKQEQRNTVFFYAMVVLGLIAVVAGFLLPQSAVNEWVGTGFILGGVISMFIGTAQYWSDMARFIRPFVIALELAVVLFIIYKRMRAEKQEVIRND